MISERLAAECVITSRVCCVDPRGRRECFGADVQAAAAAAALQTVNGLGGVHCSVLRPRARRRSCDRHLVLRSTQRTVSASSLYTGYSVMVRKSTMHLCLAANSLLNYAQIL